MAITKELFGTLPNGQDITAYLLDNGNGVSARILNYGGIVRNLYVEDKNGVKTDVVLGRFALAPSLPDVFLTVESTPLS